MAPSGMRGRPPSDEDLTLWRQITADVTPLTKKSAIALAPPAASPRYAPRPLRLAPPAGAPSAPLLPNNYHSMDGNTAARLKRGMYPVDATLDLHGMTRDQALRALERHVERSYAEQKRCLLVITGKGSAQRGAGMAGVLRTELPRWLNTEHLKPYVLAYGTASAKHGGSGAWYVVLRRRRHV